MGWGLIYWHLSAVGPNILASSWGWAYYISISEGWGLIYWHLSGVGPNILGAQWDGA